MPFVCNHENEFVFKIYIGCFHILVSSVQKIEGAAAADAFNRDGNHNTVAGCVDVKTASFFRDERLRFVFVRDRKKDSFISGLDPPQIAYLLRRGAVADKRQNHGDFQPLTNVIQNRQSVGIDYRDYKVHISSPTVR